MQIHTTVLLRGHWTSIKANKKNSNNTQNMGFSGDKMSRQGLQDTTKGKWEGKSLSHVWLCDCMDCSPPGSSVHVDSPGKRTEWVDIYFSRGCSRPRDWTWVSRMAGRPLTIWATREAPSKVRLNFTMLKWGKLSLGIDELLLFFRGGW